MLLVEFSTSCIAQYRPPSSMTSKRNKPRLTMAERRKMTRSAPPARTSPSPKHSTYTRASRARTARVSREQASISIEDIYQSAEKERLTYSTACRRQNLAHAQSQTQFFRTSEQCPMSPGLRSYTSTSRHGNVSSYGREVATPTSAWSEPVHSRPSSMVPPPELKPFIEDDDEYDDDMAHHRGSPLNTTFSPIGRDCCEIIGPQMCYECRKQRIRQVCKERSDMYFPILEPAEDNLTTAAIVKKYLPGLSDPEIENKLARGEIAKPSFRRHNKTVEFSDEEDDFRPPQKPVKKVTIIDHKHNSPRSKWSTLKPSELYFTDIQDLNNKIVTGTVGRNVGFSKAVTEVIKKKSISPSKNHFPSFVSPRKVKMVQETKYKTYFEPPLIEKAKQSTEPAFFAGSAGTYVLPEKLPDELVFVDKEGNEVKASSSQSFVAKSSAVSEGFVPDDDKKARRKSSLHVPNIGERRPSLVIREDEEEEEEEGNAEKETVEKKPQDSDN